MERAQGKRSDLLTSPNGGAKSLREQIQARGKTGSHVSTPFSGSTHAGGRPTKTTDTREAVSRPTLREMGVSDKQSSRWQQLAGVPEDDFEAALAASASERDL